MVQRGGKRPGAGRPKGSKNKTTIAREAVSEVLGIDPSDTLEAAVHQRGHTLLSEMERIVLDPTQPIGARIMAARTVLPFLLPRKETVRTEKEFGSDLVEQLNRGRMRVAEARKLTAS